MGNNMFGADMLGGAEGMGFNSGQDIIAQLEQIQRIMAQQNDPAGFEMPHKGTETANHEGATAQKTTVGSTQLVSDLKTNNSNGVSDLD